MDVEPYVNELTDAAVAAARALANASTDVKNEALERMAEDLLANADELKDVLSVVLGRQPKLIASAAQDVDWEDLMR